MRLTLRTLLAWMDGVLPPDEQAQLGEKVEGSPVACQLVARIGACLGNPRLSAPRINGKGLAVDPDTVAQYLDNTLAPERLEAFETICLESDMHLAEVAACHAILAEVAKHPEVLPPLDASHRRQLLEAMRHRVAAHPEVIAGQSPGGHTGAPRRPEVTQPVQAPAPFEPRERAPAPTPQGPVASVDAPPSRTPWGAWALAGSALLLLAFLAALLAQSAGLFRAAPRPREAVARLDGGQVPAPPGPIGDGAAEPAAAEDVAPPAAAAIGAAGGQPRGLAELLAAADADPIPPVGPADGTPAADTDTVDGAAPTFEAALGPGDFTEAGPGPEAEATMPDPGPRKVRAGEALAIAAGVRPRKPTNPPPQGGGGEGITAKDGGNDLAAAVGLEGDGGTAAESLGFVAADGLLLRAVAAGDRVWWVPIGVGTPLHSGETLIVPPGMQPELNLAGVSLRVLPRSLITLETAADGTPRVWVVEGRVVARAARGETRLGIVAGGIAGTVTAGLDGAVTVERAAVWSPGLGEVAVVAEVIAVGRLVRWIPDADGAAVDLPARGGLRWESTAPQQTAPLPSGRVPPWGIDGERIDPLVRNAAETFTARLAALPPESDPAAGLDDVTLALAIDRRVENRVFAATLLALEGSYEVAVEVLCAEGPGKRLEGRQWQALEAATISLALARGVESAARLRKAWEDRGPPGRAELLMAMARGPEDPDLAAGAGATLVEGLASTELVVRRYALKNLVDIVEPSVFDRARFRPDAPEEARRDGVAWWRSLQEKGLVRRSR